MTTYKDISTKIDSATVEVLSCIKDIADKLGIPFFLVGAKARDLFFSLLFDIQTTRATLDVDLGIKVNSWDDVAKLIDGIIATGLFKPANKLNSRFVYSKGTILDIVPFGLLETPSGKIQWPLDEAIMSTVGFEEAFIYSLDVCIRTSPQLHLKVCTPPAMVMLKLIAWNEKYPERARDAQDIIFILQHYIDAGNDSRLHEEDNDIQGGRV